MGRRGYLRDTPFESSRWTGRRGARRMRAGLRFRPPEAATLRHRSERQPHVSGRKQPGTPPNACAESDYLDTPISAPGPPEGGNGSSQPLALAGNSTESDGSGRRAPGGRTKLRSCRWATFRRLAHGSTPREYSSRHVAVVPVFSVGLSTGTPRHGAPDVHATGALRSSALIHECPHPPATHRCGLLGSRPDGAPFEGRLRFPGNEYGASAVPHGLSSVGGAGSRRSDANPWGGGGTRNGWITQCLLSRR